MDKTTYTTKLSFNALSLLNVKPGGGKPQNGSKVNITD
ncbi:hypothetical protein Mucpa_2537 [Mucilaginibacter paludis DSM 18603]|uniref:Uncharacterized protein n=1 Tax=Mucilaginibacter paludis DSM 18603 TaxID=714943 RepID=H1XZK8_9SPHI|nr:hypothetical protein Mucpa_2537 [Mucilaginibacter paludis DSM 18603]